MRLVFTESSQKLCNPDSVEMEGMGVTVDQKTGWDWPTPQRVFKKYAVIGCIGYKIAGRTAPRLSLAEHRSPLRQGT